MAVGDIRHMYLLRQYRKLQQNIALNSPLRSIQLNLTHHFFCGLPVCSMAGEKCVIIIYELEETHCSKCATFMYKAIYIYLYILKKN